MAFTNMSPTWKPKNDCAERGIKLISDFQDCCFDRNERETLAQLVKDHRSTIWIHKFNKEGMKNANVVKHQSTTLGRPSRLFNTAFCGILLRGR